MSAISNAIHQGVQKHNENIHKTNILIFALGISVAHVPFLKRGIVLNSSLVVLIAEYTARRKYTGKSPTLSYALFFHPEVFSASQDAIWVQIDTQPAQKISLVKSGGPF